MNENKQVKNAKRIGIAAAFLFYPILASFAFAAHPNLFSLALHQSTENRITEFHNNSTLHLAHFLMLVAAPLLIVIAVHFTQRLQGRAAWLGFIGGILAVSGSVILAVDKGALCLVPSAFDTLPEEQFGNLLPGIEAMFDYRGWLWILRLLPLLPIGFILQTGGLVISREIPRRQSIPMLAGSILMANPDIDLIGLIASVVLAAGFFPYAMQYLQHRNPQASAIQA